jgi:ABC-type lipoprotein release transport system permease subunit
VFANAGTAAAGAGLTDAGFRPTAPPANVERLDQVGSIPWYLAAFLGVLALAGVAHSLASAARRRRGDLAIVRTLGLTASGASRSFGWQATMIAVAGTAAGLLLGVVGGRVVWGIIADKLGVLDDPVVPPGPAILVAAAMIGSAIAIAFVPAVRARRLRPVELLRAE